MTASTTVRAETSPVSRADEAETNAFVGQRGSTLSRMAAIGAALTLRPITGLIQPEQAWGLWLSRQIVARTMDACGPSLSGTQVEPVDTLTADGRRVVGEWVRAKGVTRTDAAVYYLHGSGYSMCSARTHRRLTAWISKLTGLPVLCSEYRLAPRHRFPAAAEDVRAGWDWLLETTALPASRIVVGGDSAGGHLAVDLMLQVAGIGQRAAGLTLFSPLVDVTFGLAAAREQLRRDPAISAAGAARLVRLYYDGIDPTHPRLTLNVADGPALPPTLIQAGGAEMLAADAHGLADDIRFAGGTCELQVWPDQVHVFQALPRLVPEATRAMAFVAEFVENVLRTNDTSLEGRETA